uniref:Fe-S metabolism associated domain-containing protein n=1 Tax=Erythrolobus madagascarensis TaxID=708628 RepID=A0A6T9YY35_9RHOD
MTDGVGFVLTPTVRRGNVREKEWSGFDCVERRARRCSHISGRNQRCRAVSMHASSGKSSATQLPPNLADMVRKFKLVPDPKLRYQQLLFLAKELPPMKDELKVPENKVPGCLSTVYVDVTLDEKTGLVALAGDSDAQLTKGLIALLIKGFSGATVEEVLGVDPEFIVDSGLSVSLTPGRNNGFLNMLDTIKTKLQAAPALSVEEKTQSESSDEEDMEENSFDVDSSRPVYSSIMKKLQVLKPSVLEVVDDSASHAGHAGAKGLNGESHFGIQIVSPMFEGVSLVKRHQLIYALLEDEMKQSIHALQIQAQAESEQA